MALKFRRVEFEYRIFISMTIVAIISLFALILSEPGKNTFFLIAGIFNLNAHRFVTGGYIFEAFVMVLASLLRMWSGSHLSSDRIMAFKVQSQDLIMSGPFALVRNPVYLADLIAFLGFSLCLPPIGFLIPVLIWLHYIQLISYEEKTLHHKFGQQFDEYTQKVPRLIPSLRSFGRFLRFERKHLNYDGIRHNALYLLFIPGFIVAAVTDHFAWAVIIGIPAVIDWAVIHTIKGVAKHTDAQALTKEKTGKSKVFSNVLYSNCWEDPEIDLTAFRISEADTVFSITSGGCNVLAFLTCNPKKVIALDLNPFQNYLLELKMAAFRHLTYNDLLEFLGVTESENRFLMYTRLRNSLSSDTLAFWEDNTDKIESGILHCGRFEGYMRLLSKGFRMVVGKKTVIRLLSAENTDECNTVYDKHINNIKWKLFTQIFLSRAFMSLMFDKAFFAQLEESFSFGNHFRQVIHRALTERPLQTNPFLFYIVTGNYHPTSLPFYLKHENYETIRKNLDKVEIVNQDCLSYFTKLPDNSISKFNFTNIFEWMPVETFEHILRESVRVATTDAVITYRNLLVPRQRPTTLATKIEPQPELSEALHKQDLSFMYRSYHVEKINKNELQG